MNPTRVTAYTGWSYFPVAFAARFPYAMLVVGALTLVVTARGSLTLGGLNSAAIGIGTALCGPLIGAAADRFGQRRTLVVAAAANTAAILALVAVVECGLPAAALLSCAFLIGATAPQVGPMSRTRLVHVVADHFRGPNQGRVLNAVMAYESAADEIVFVFGPVVVGALAVAFGADVAVIGAAALTLVFVTWFALHPTGRIGSGSGTPPPPVRARELSRSDIAVLALGTLATGMFFGTMLTSLTAFLDARGQADSAGLLYGLMGVGSTVLALSVAAFPERFTLRWRWLVFAAVVLVAAGLYGTSQSTAAIAVALLLAGIGIGPSLVTMYAIAGRRAPHGAVATTLSILGSALILGQALASAVTGRVADSAGAPAAMLLPVAAAAIMVAASVWNARLSVAAEGRGSAAGSGAADRVTEPVSRTAELAPRVAEPTPRVMERASSATEPSARVTDLAHR